MSTTHAAIAQLQLPREFCYEGKLVSGLAAFRAVFRGRLYCGLGMGKGRTVKISR